MKKIRNFIKKNKLIILAIIFTLIIIKGGVDAAGAIEGTNVTYKDNYNLGATTVQAAVDKLCSKVSNIDTRVTTLETLGKISKSALLAGGTSTSYSSSNLKNAAGLFVTTQWNGYYVTQPVLVQNAPYHFVFDLSGSMYTATVVWNTANGTVSVTNRSDVYIYAITMIE